MLNLKLEFMFKTIYTTNFYTHQSTLYSPFFVFFFIQQTFSYSRVMQIILYCLAMAPIRRHIHILCFYRLFLLYRGSRIAYHRAYSDVTWNGKLIIKSLNFL